MNTETEMDYIRQCLHEIEAKLNWGASTDWTNYDFEKLSSLIQDTTRVVLSISTLKRLWGKVAYQHTPALQTLNTIARFAGYEDWRTFKQTTKHGIDPLPQPKQEEPMHSSAGRVIPVEPGKAKKEKKLVWLLTLVPLAIVSYLLVALIDKSEPPLDSSRFQFKANKMVTRGLPNSVVFNYDATAALTDSVYIVQTWDISRKKLVPKDRFDHSAIYYYPGFFRTKLIADGQVVKTHDLLIATDGWLVLEEQEPEPLYFKKEEFGKGDRIEVDRATLQSYNISLFPKPPRIRFFNMQELGPLMNDNFIFETTLKNGFNEGTNACQYVEVLIQCKDDVIIIPLAAQTCVGNINLYACGKQVRSKEADLSGFGCDLTQWTTLKVETINKHMTFYVNGRAACSFTFPNDPTGIVGVQYRFYGLGAVKDTRFTSAGKIYLF